ncbi:phosphoribosylformylglycinamidine synthase I [Pyrobaculum sp.]|uniref:phosphoribosylformylglycinamidine synthase I n=1 Tax=Pyrobaculum sp. TaxID=2004705 RepID=UPI003169EFBB
MIAVLKFPGTNGDYDVLRALELAGLRGEIVWYKDYRPGAYDAVVLAGGFSYGDRLRAGAVAAATKAVEHVREGAERGVPVLGICNGFQILVEAGLLPGALIPNDPPGFISRWIPIRVVDNETPFTLLYQRGEVVYMPVAHAEGRYIPEGSPRAVFKYVENPNGSVDDIAGVARGNVLGLMPHPERAVDPRISRNGVGGLKLWLSLKEWLRR